MEIKFSKKHLIYTILWITILFFKSVLIQYNYHNSYLLLLLHKVSILIGLMAIWSFYDFVVKNRDLTKSRLNTFSDYSFFIFVFHEPMLSFLKKNSFLLNK